MVRSFTLSLLQSFSHEPVDRRPSGAASSAQLTESTSLPKWLASSIRSSTALA
jgi:hypothetical protein